MNQTEIKPREAIAVITALTGGVTPRLGIQHITVGRDKEVAAILNDLSQVKKGQGIVKFWIGDFGSGKSFMLQLLTAVAQKERFVTSTADFSPERRLYSNDGRAVAIYSAIIEGLSIQTKPDGGALEVLLEKWIENILFAISEQTGISIPELQAEENEKLVKTEITKAIHGLTDVGAFNFSQAIIAYYHGFIFDDQLLKRNAIRWLKAEYQTKSEAKTDLGVKAIIDDQNWYDMLRNLCRFVVSIGYSGLMINLDEAVNLYKISNLSMRQKNYEKLLFIYNDCLQGHTQNLFINIAGTKDFLTNERRGLYSYEALKTRLEQNKFETNLLRDFAQPVIQLIPLSPEDIFVLLSKLLKIFNVNYNTTIELSQNDITTFMEKLLNQPGAKSFLTPREVIREFLNILNIKRQNPGAQISDLIQPIKLDFSKSAEVDSIIEEL